MTSTLNPDVVLGLLIVAALMVGSYLLARRQRSRGHASSPKPWRLETPASRTIEMSSAQTVLKAVQELQTAGANWNTILMALNPDNDAALASELQAIRGPHMFVPATALQVLEHGCQR